MVTPTPDRIVVLARQGLRFLESECRFHIVDQYSSNLGCGLEYVRGSTFLSVGWDLRENSIGADFYPFDHVTHRPRLSERIILGELIAINGGRASEQVVAPPVLTDESVRGAAVALGRLLRTYAGPLLDDEWGDIPRRVRDWTASGAWRAWRDK